MPRTQANTPLSAGKLPAGTLSDPKTSDGASSYAQTLCQNSQMGEFDAALAELAAAPHLGTDDSPLLSELRETVARELTRRADHLYEDLTTRAVHVLGISSYSSENMMVDGEQQLHLLTKRLPCPGAIGESLHTACGQQFWSDLETPMLSGMRGSWHSPQFYDVHRCDGCAQHASQFPEVTERPGDPGLPPAVGKRVGDIVRQSVCQDISEDMAAIASIGAVPALEAAELRYHTALTLQLAAQARAGGDELLQRVLLYYYAMAQRELAACGYTGTMSAVVSDKDWNEAVANTLEDLWEADNGAVAQSFLYSELRLVINDRIHTERKLNSP